MPPAPKRKKKTTRPAHPAVQWAMALVGGVVTLSAVGVIVWEALQPAAPPALSARIVGVQATAAGHVAEVRVSNAGSDTAAAVEIEGVLGVERARATLDYVPARGHAEAFLRFDADPRAAVVTVKGWSAP